MNTYCQNTLSTSRGTLNEQTSTIGIVENELNQAKDKLQLLQQEKSNKIRLIEINNYFGEKYAEHGNLMKIIIAILLPTLILAILNQKGILPNTVYYILLIIIAVIGFYFLWMRILSIWHRDNMNYQEYDWAFDPSNVTISKGSTRDPWTVYTKASVVAHAACVGDACCSTGLTWDASRNQCVIGGASSPSSLANNAAPVSGNNNNSNNRNPGNNGNGNGNNGNGNNSNGSNLTNQVLDLTNPFTESFVNNVLSQPAYAFKKPDVVLGGNYVQPSSGTTSSLYTPF
jgi:hypothetical protein